MNNEEIRKHLAALNAAWQLYARAIEQQLDILYGGAIDHFCLVTSDSDYTPLVLRLGLPGARCWVLENRRRLSP